MKTTTELKEFAQLAQASYAELNSQSLYNEGDPPTKTIEALESSPNGGFSEGQATDFTNRYKVLDRFRDFNTTANGGFSGTLFQDKDNPNRLVLSLAGTEFENDKRRDLVTEPEQAMKTTTELKEFAQLAQAAYANLDRDSRHAPGYAPYTDAWCGCATISKACRWCAHRSRC